MIDILILAASPRKNGNTGWLVGEFADELRSLGKSIRILDLYDLGMKGCAACRECQRDWSRPACALGDEEVFDAVLGSSTIVLATPVYSWYCTAPAKAFLDRCVYAMNKYYGVPEDDGRRDEKGEPLRKRGPSLWEGKRMALITTFGYPQEKGPDLLEEGIRRYCAHSRLVYAGAFKARHMGYDTAFADTEKKAGIRAFARELAGK